MSWFEQLLKSLAPILQDLGVPQDQLDVAALGVVYAAVVLAALLLILLLLRVARVGRGTAAVKEAARYR